MKNVGPLMLKKQGLWFLFVGIIQYVLDCLIFAFLLSLAGYTSYANITSRFLAASSGFIINRKITFSDQCNSNSICDIKQLKRFVFFWLIMTTLSTVLIYYLSSWQGLHGDDDKTYLLSKLTVEAFLAVTSFIVSKFWIFVESKPALNNQKSA